MKLAERVFQQEEHTSRQGVWAWHLTTRLPCSNGTWRRCTPPLQAHSLPAPPPPSLSRPVPRGDLHPLLLLWPCLLSMRGGCCVLPRYVLQTKTTSTTGECARNGVAKSSFLVPSLAVMFACSSTLLCEPVRHRAFATPPPHTPPPHPTRARALSLSEYAGFTRRSCRLVITT